MNEFVASNGMIISPDEDGDLRLLSPSRRNTLRSAPFLDDDEKQALREFFRAEEDARLGRWRWPENPDYVVYSMLSLRVRVVNERDGVASEFTEEDTRLKRPSYEGRAARAYFDAHPEPKPAWHDAKPGEVWELTVEGATRNYAAILSSGLRQNYVRFFPVDDVHAPAPSAEAPVITAGHRIYPEVAS